VFETRSLSHRFSDGTLALREVTLRLPFRGFTVIAGRNGAGKTLLSRHLVGLLRPTAGSVLLDGVPVGENTEAVRRRVGIVFQDPDSQFIGQTVAEDIAFGLEQRRSRDGGTPREAIEERVERVLRAFGLEEVRDRDPHTLSGGEKRRVAIAAVAVVEPQLLILDEPFANLDFPGVSSVLNRIVAVASAGTGVLLITHEVEKVLAHAERLIVFEEGSVAADDHPSTLLPKLGTWGLRKPPLPLSELTWIG
jgi:biotin transport system ATP-binding protein